MISVSMVISFSLVSCKAAEETTTEETVAEETTAEETAEMSEDELFEKLYGDIYGATINYLGWQGYDGAGVIEPFLEKYNITLNTVFVNNNEEIFTKLKAGGGSRYDIVTPYFGILPAFLESDLLEPLDLSLLPNYEDSFDIFKNVDWNKKDGGIYSIPFVWGVTGFLYNADEVETPTTFDILLDPQYKNKIIIQEDNVGSILEAALWLGFEDASRLTKEQLEQVYDRLVELKKNTRYLSPSFGDVQKALESGEALMCFNGWDAVAMWCQANGVNIKTAIPDEGTHAFVDNYCIPKGAKNQMAAYAFIHYLTQPEVQAEFCAILSSGVVNKKSVEFLPEINKNAYPYDDLEEYFTKVHLCPPTPLESDEFTTTADWAAMWERFKLAE